ncbi:MAG: 2-hydroxyacyl-CoA dehydratase [Clostridia bacterium]|nr:2-hydroxyacyl-CoA dehydratase [Clostridia bacterium]
MAKVGLTTTIPMEIIYAAGDIPVDLNNIFITHETPQGLVEEAEIAGYPRNLCGWIKGLYSTVLQAGDISKVVAVTQGDCSNTHALMETLEVQGIETIPFAFPFDRDRDMLKLQIEKLMAAFGVDWDQVNEAKARLDKVRRKVWRLDEATWRENKVSGFDNHLWLVSCSDFNGDPEGFEADLDRFMAGLEAAREYQQDVRLGYIGVPPIFTDLYDYLESQGARVVFNEVQRQFTLPFDTDDLVEQYRNYTYPYNIFFRLEDIRREIEKRNIEGIIHYTQSFCFRQIEDIIIRQKLDVPILTLEGDKPSKLDARSKMRIDAFIEMLR